MRKIALILISIAAFPLSKASGVTISEMMYNPAGGDESLEYVELYNEDIVPFEIGGWRFSDGIEYVFPAGTMMPPRSHLLVCNDVSVARAAYGVSNVFGPYSGRLNNAGERVSLANPYGAVVQTVRYSDRYPWPAAADGTGHSLSLRDVYLPVDEYASWTNSSVIGGTPGQANNSGAVIRRRFLVGPTEEWRFFKGVYEASKPTDAWRYLGFDDSYWLVGRGPFGYGIAGCGTVLDDMRGQYISVFLRKKFVLQNPADVKGLLLHVDYEDGFVAYLNGVEVARRSLGNPGDTVWCNTPAAEHESGTPEDIDISDYLFLLRPGENVLSIQAHNSSLKSSDFYISASLLEQFTVSVTSAIPIVINEIRADSAEAGWVELWNPSKKEYDIGGCFLSDDPTDLLKYRIPDGTIMGPNILKLFPSWTTGLPLPTGGGAVYLTSSDGMRVLDAFACDAETADISRGRYPDGVQQWWAMVKPTPGKPNEISVECNIAINEIMYHPPGNAEEDEYIELFNKGDYPVSLDGWALTDGINFLFSGVTIPAGGYLVVAKSPETIRAKYGIENVVGPFIGVLRNEGERLELRDPLGNIADEVYYYDGGRWPVWAGGGGSSLELIDPRQDNSVPSAWDASDETKKAEWKHYEYSGVHTSGESEFHMFLMHRGICHIDNIEFRESGGVNQIPNGTFDAGAASWLIQGNHIQSAWTTEDSFGKGACLKIVATGRGDTGVNRIECDLNPTLRYGVTYTVSFWAKWQRGTNLLMTRTWNHSVAKANRLEMPERLGTPGKVNSVFKPNLGPLISEVKQFPIVPTSADSVWVRARVTDTDGVASATLYHRTGTGTKFLMTEMFDDGRHGDSEPGDGVYGASLPARSEWTIVGFYIEATDALGELLRFPAEAPSRNALYQVENTRPSTSLNVYRLLMSPENLNELNARPPLSNELLDGTFIFNDSEIYYNVGARYRGSPWGRPSRSRYRIAFNRDEPCHGVREMNLDPNDGTRQRERFAFHLVRKMGAPAPNHKYCYFGVNNGYHTICDDVQKVDKDFAAFWWNGDDGGTLYKVDDYFTFTDSGSFTNYDTARFVYRGDDRETYRWNFMQRTNEWFDDYTDLIELVKAFDPSTTPDSEFEKTLEATSDTDEWLRVLATRILIGDWDCVGYWRGKNCYFYRPPGVGKWMMIPWDSDLVFEANHVSDAIFQSGFPGIYRFLNWPRYKRRYYGFLQELLDGPFGREQADPLLDSIYDILRREGSVSSPDDIKGFLTSRAAFVRPQIPMATFAITTNGGNPFFSGKSQARIQGTAPVNALYFTLNGVASEPEWPDKNDCTVWRYSVELTRGVNNLAITAYDFSGRVVGSSSIAVSYDPDDDGDGLRYLEEIALGTDPDNPDTDGDLVTDYEEVKATYTDPLDARSTPHHVLDTDRLPSGETSVSWRSIVGRYYAIMWTEDLLNWFAVPGYIRADQNITVWTDRGQPETPLAPSEDAVRWRFYRVILMHWEFSP